LRSSTRKLPSGQFSIERSVRRTRTSQEKESDGISARQQDLQLREAGCIGSGIALGLAFSIGLGRWITHWIADSGHHVLLSLVGASVIIVIAAIACLAPARKASSVSPSAALRAK